MQLKTALLLIGLGVSCKHSETQPEITIGAAISLKESMDAITPRLEKETQMHVRFVYGASGDLAAQMAHGAPFDVLASAGEEKSLDSVADESCTLAWNTLALVKHRGTARYDWDALASSPAKFRLAIGLTPQVPAGVYAEEAFHRAGTWDAIAPKVVRGTNVRHVLDLVARGEADEGIVYATDVKLRADIELVALVPENMRPNVRYPLYVSKQASLASTHASNLLCDDETKRTLLSRGFLDHKP